MTLFVDTNTLLHYQPVDQINWKDVVPGEQLILAYSLVVIDELDKHKQNPRLSSRARFVQNQFVQFRQAGKVSDDVKIITVPKPHSRVLIALDLDTSQNDLWLLASILDYQSTHPEEKVAVLTSDTGMQLRAEFMNIQVVRLNEKYAIAVESDEQKELKKIRQELAGLKNAIPKLEIKLALDNQDGYEIVLPDFPRYLESEMRKVKAKYPKLNEFTGYSMGSRGDYATRPEIITYNRQLDNYYENYQGYVRASQELYQMELLTITLMPMLANMGSVPARSIDIEFTFSDLVSIHTQAPVDRLQHSRMPLAPTLGNIASPPYAQERSSHPFYQPNLDPVPQISQWQSGETTVKMSVDNLKQQTVESLDFLYATFNDVGIVKGFNIDYEIRADNVPNVVTGQLNVKVTVS